MLLIQTMHYILQLEHLTWSDINLYFVIVYVQHVLN